MGLSFANQIAYRMIRMHNLKRRHTAPAVQRRNQLLGNNRFQNVRKLYADLLLLMRREYIDYTVYRTDKTRCPVSAAVIATLMVSKSRISPTRITSGSSRSAARSAFA